MKQALVLPIWLNSPKEACLDNLRNSIWLRICGVVSEHHLTELWRGRMRYVNMALVIRSSLAALPILWRN